MNTLSYYQAHGAEQSAKVAEAAGTSLANFRQIMYGGSVSRKLAKKLSEASGGEMQILAILFPDDSE